MRTTYNRAKLLPEDWAPLTDRMIVCHILQISGPSTNSHPTYSKSLRSNKKKDSDSSDDSDSQLDDNDDDDKENQYESSMILTRT